MTVPEHKIAEALIEEAMRIAGDVPNRLAFRDMRPIMTEAVARGSS